MKRVTVNVDTNEVLDVWAKNADQVPVVYASSSAATNSKTIDNTGSRTINTASKLDDST